MALGAVVLSGCASPARPTQEQRADVTHFVQSSLDVAWRGDGRTDRPSVLTPTFLLPNGWPFRMQQCMVDSGFEAYRYDRTAGFTNGLERTTQTGTEGLAWYYCSALFPTYDTVFSTPEQPELDALYGYYTGILVPCLTLKGAAVHNVPSQAAFDGGGLGQPGSWNPYLTAELPDSVGVAELLLASCPPYPDRAA